jgi:hypothetical protein
MLNTLYDQDFYALANEQAALLRAGKLDAADIEHIAEEIESMGRSEKRELINRLAVLLLHLLKWQFQPERRGNSWRLTIKGQRRSLGRHLADNPSLKSQLPSAIEDAYGDALIEAERETELPGEIFPSSCPFTYEEAISDDFWPD